MSTENNIITGVVSVSYDNPIQLAGMLRMIENNMDHTPLKSIIDKAIQPYLIKLVIEATYEKDNYWYYYLEFFLEELTATFESKVHLTIFCDNSFVSKIIENGIVTSEIQTGKLLDQSMSKIEKFSYIKKCLEENFTKDEMDRVEYNSVIWSIRNRRDFREWYIQSDFYVKKDSIMEVQFEFSELVDVVNKEKEGVKGYRVWMERDHAGMTCGEGFNIRLPYGEPYNDSPSFEQYQQIGALTQDLIVDGGLDKVSKRQASSIIKVLETDMATNGRGGCLGLISFFLISGTFPINVIS